MHGYPFTFQFWFSLVFKVLYYLYRTHYNKKHGLTSQFLHFLHAWHHNHALLSTWTATSTKFIALRSRDISITVSTNDQRR